MGTRGMAFQPARVTFDEHGSMMREPRTEPQRIGIEAPTNCGRSQLHRWHYVDARACAWKAVDGYVFLTDRQKNFGRGGRRDAEQRASTRLGDSHEAAQQGGRGALPNREQRRE